MDKLVRFDMITILERLFRQFEPLCITLWLCAIIFKDETEWFKYDEDNSREDIEDNAFWMCALIGGIIFASGILFNLFPILTFSSGYLKISGIIMIIISIIYLFIKKPNTELIKKPLFIVNLITICSLVLSTLFIFKDF